MTEDLSPIYEQVSIEDWADRIHQIKVQELKEIVDKERKNFDYYAGLAQVNSFADVNEALEGLVVGLTWLKLKFKYDMLLKHGRK